MFFIVSDTDGIAGKMLFTGCRQTGNVQWTHISLMGFAALVIVGVALVVFVVKVVWALLPAAIVAAVVFIFTASMWWAGVAFLAVIVLSMLAKLVR